MDCDWELSQSFTSDGQGIRAACVLPCNNNSTKENGGDWFKLVAGSQGGSLYEYSVPSGNLVPIEYQHNHSVTAMLSFELFGQDDTNKYYYATGCKDSTIRVFDAQAHQLQFELKGHEKAVTSLDFLAPHFLVSGSWDGTAKVWNLHTKSLVSTMAGHENTVSVCGLSASSSSLRVATGSAGIAQGNSIRDHAVRLWQVTVSTGESKELTKVSNDHEGPIRDLSFGTHNGELATCSNDGTVRLRSPETAETTATLVFVPSEGQSDHPPMLLSVASMQNNGYAASAEDGHVILWSNNTTTILRHAQCVWSVLPLPNGDIATSSQDGTLRIFTLAQERMAPEQEREAFRKDAQDALAKKSKGPSADEIAKLPKWEMNALTKGRSEGQVQVFNKNGVAIAAQWSDASQTWIEVGQVMGTSEDGGQIDGQQYDHVLPIEMDTTDGGVAKLQLGYNNGENPFVAAQRFIDAHVLPQHHLSEIADYIRQRTGNNSAPTIGMEASAGSGGTASMTPVSPALLLDHLPAKGYKSFELSAKTGTTALEKMVKKMQEFENADESIMSMVQSLVETLGASNRYHASKISNEELTAVKKMLSSWPSAQAFPALDLARMSVLHPDASSRQRTNYWNEVIQLALQQCNQVTDADGTAAMAIPMLTLRLFANCFKGGPGSMEAVSGNLDSVLTCAESFAQSKNKNIRLSVATVLLNTAFFLHSSTGGGYAGLHQRVVSIVSVILQSNSYESEAMIRTLVALGTIVLANAEAKDAAKSLFLGSKVEPAAYPHGDKAKAIAKEIYSLIG